MDVDVPTRGNLSKAIDEFRIASDQRDTYLIIAHDDGCPTLDSDEDEDCNCEFVTVQFRAWKILLRWFGGTSQ